MQVSNRLPFTVTRAIVILFTAGLAIAVIAVMLVLRGGSTPSDLATLSLPEPAIVELIENSDLNRIILTERAAERLRIQTEAVRTEEVNGEAKLVVPYSAVYYAPTGEAWVYTSPEPLVYVRHPITVDRIDGDTAFLTEGPPADTSVVTVGVTELYGSEFEIGH
jgi:hypothetical protein